jgi:hypothetical protein
MVRKDVEGLLMLAKRCGCRYISGGRTGRSYLRTKSHSHAPRPPPHAGLNGRQEAMQNTDGMADVSQPAYSLPQFGVWN